MNPAKQFWALFRFQTTINPFIVLLPFVLALPLWMKFFRGGDHFHSSLDVALLTAGQNLFFVGFIGIMVLAPEIFQVGGSSPLYASGTEFLLTRAVDRRTFCRARTAFFYAIILVTPLIILLAALGSPGLQLTEYRETSHTQILAHITGSISGPADNRGKSVDITIPNGNVLVEGWNFDVFALTAIGAQVLIFLLYPCKYRRTLIFAIFALIFLPILDLHNSSGMDKMSTYERLFLFFTAHQTVCWVLTFLAFMLAQLWCERRFARLEQ
jgi:hypothetical protein